MYGNDTLHKGILYSIVEQYMSTPLKRMVSTLCTVLSALKRREIGLDGVQFAQYTTSLGVNTETTKQQKPALRFLGFELI